MSAAWSVNRLAIQAVARHAPGTPAQKYELLEMLGLVDDNGDITPDDTKVHVITDVGKAPGAKDPDASSPLGFADHGRRPDNMTTPAGLANLPPIVAAPVPSKPLPPHGTRRRFRVHRLAGEECQQCRDAENLYSKNYQAAQRAAKKASA